MNDTFEEELDIAPAPTQLVAVLEVPDETSRDFDYARENIYTTIEVAQNALTELAHLAKSSQAARTYEVLATLTRTIIDAQHQLIELQKKKVEIEKVTGPAQDQPNIVNNNLYLTTAALGRMIEDIEKGRGDADLSDVPDTTQQS
jgi:hypothetical protein